MVLSQKFVAHSDGTPNTLRTFSHQDPEGYPPRFQRIIRKPYCGCISGADLVNYAIPAIVVEIAKVNRVVASLLVVEILGCDYWRLEII
jgi:hypothetical protein